jgi:hypothetical protein
MDWKQKLIAATSAFVSMPLANALEVNQLVGGRRAVRVKQSVSTVPFFADLGVDKLYVAVRTPEVAEDGAVDGPEPCTNLTVEAKLVNTLDGTELKKIIQASKPGGGTIIEFDFQEMYGTGAIRADGNGSVSALVEVYPASEDSETYNDSRVCTASEALVSFTIKGLEGRTFVPSKTTGEKIPAHFIKEVTAEH